jgi:hypothetical protein
MPARNNKGGVTIRDVTHTAVSMEQLRQYVSAEANTRNNGGAVFSVRSMPRGYKKDKEDRLSLGEFRDTSLPAHELESRGIEA